MVKEVLLLKSSSSSSSSSSTTTTTTTACGLGVSAILYLVMGAYGYNIEHILMVDIILDQSVRKAMIEINAAQRIQLASVYKGEAELGRRLTVESVVDVLQLARLCDAPDLYLKCMNLMLREEKAV
ncbi:hypothetical protein Scep_010509 [Stephania cephalantha]|uniref:Uncharacterized protein n=1 Tax=Stephania cephalantha TaxID=152367 RepID=A0AAP0PDD6_9MAGN